MRADISAEVNPELRYRRLWLLVGYALLGVIVYLSVTSQPLKLDLAFPYQDKVSHALAYFVLTAWFAQIYHSSRQRMYHAVVFILMGVALEGVQSFDPARMTEFADMLANTSGVALAVILTRHTSLGWVLTGFEKRLLRF